MRECVHPKNAEEYHLNKHARRKVVERGHVIRASNPFFCSADTPFNIGNVLVFAANVEFRLQNCRHIASGAFKFGVTKNICDPKAAFAIDKVDSLKGFDE